MLYEGRMRFLHSVTGRRESGQKMSDEDIGALHPEWINERNFKQYNKDITTSKVYKKHYDNDSS